MTDTGLTPAESLTILLTAETLFFAALSVAVVLGQDTERGLPLPTSAFAFALAVSGVISALAVGAGAAWYDAFARPGLDGLTTWLQGIAVAVAIVAEAGFAWWIAASIRS